MNGKLWPTAFIFVSIPAKCLVVKFDREISSTLGSIQNFQRMRRLPHPMASRTAMAICRS